MYMWPLGRRLVQHTGWPRDHLTVVCSMTWPLNGSDARGELVLIQTSLLLLCRSSCSNANQVHLHDKCREVCIKARSPPASLPCEGQITKETTVKWFIGMLMFYRSLSKMLKMHVQAKLNSFMTNIATEQRNYTAESLLSFRQVIYQTRNSVFHHIFKHGEES